ncbi:hypothetical protein [Microbacterium sp. Clip185]|uniref:hypothetical protein n=1 Tax=Microbacterium sp. Clip185 TaxID=3025663 RepID=UPI002366E4D4|nr:hypothetical protein [Microbacterium sp. Clip185]WDG18182.1 hypothetical protein PQV94_00245 [Microbacterium sp. Clip185]
MDASAEVPVGQVVVFVDRWSDAAPTELPVRPVVTARSHRVRLILMALVSVLILLGAVNLWSEPTPGWWFSLLFTGLAAAALAALWMGFAGSVRRSSARAQARARWADPSGEFEQLEGTVASRRVSTIEDGTVDSFELGVETNAGGVFGRWERTSAGAPMLPASQQPQTGAPARVWRIRGTEEDAPLVVEVRNAA